MSSFFSLFLGGQPPARRRNSMRTVEDLFDAKVITPDDYIDLKGSLLSGKYDEFQNVLERLLQALRKGSKASVSGSNTYADLEALYVKAQQLAQRKEQMEQLGGEEDGDDNEEDEDDEDEDNEEDGDDGHNNVHEIADSEQTPPVSQFTGGSRFARNYGPDYSPRYTTRQWR